MKASPLTLAVSFVPAGHPEPAGERGVRYDWQPDLLNRTILHLNGSHISGGPLEIKEGDRIGLEIPSGQWDGIVKGFERRPCDPYALKIIVFNAKWSGKWAGLQGGLSGLFTWEVRPRAETQVITSAWPGQPVPYCIYEAAQAAVDAAAPEGFWGQPEARRRALEDLIRVMMRWKN